MILLRLIYRSFDKWMDKLAGRQNVMGIIEIIKKIEHEEAFEKSFEKNRVAEVIKIALPVTNRGKH